MTWQLADTNGVGVVRERYWLTFAPGEIRTCASCHGINETSQANKPAPTNTPLPLFSSSTIGNPIPPWWQVLARVRARIARKSLSSADPPNPA